MSSKYMLEQLHRHTMPAATRSLWPKALEMTPSG